MHAQVDSWLRIHEVFHPTDCSPGSNVALAHALKLSLTAKARLTLMRVSPEEGVAAADELPDVRGTIARWLATERGGEPTPELQIRWHAASGSSPVRSCLQSLERIPADLIVVATHQHDGRSTWMGTSIAEPLVRSSGEMTLLVPEGAAGFVRPENGTITLKNILIPVAPQPSFAPAIEAARRLMLYLPEAEGTATVLHVGDPAGMPELRLPKVPGWRWDCATRSGDLIETILETAGQACADLIVMTTQGRQGFLEALRGSTTERVLRQSQCPMLTMPVGSFLG